MPERRPRALTVLSVVLAVACFGIVQGSGDDPFPEPAGLRGNVEFWVRVFSEWTIGQAAVHDLEYPGIVYEIVELRGEIEERYTDEQTEALEDLREDWEDFLSGIVKRRSAGKALDELQQQWADYIVEIAGPDALRDAHKRLRTQRGLRERFRDGLGRASRYEGRIREIFREAGLPEDLAYLPHVESSFQYHARSSAGASGLWQFTRSTGRDYLRIDSTVDQRLDPLAATAGAAEYLGSAHAKLESWPLALTSYNYGVHGMMRAKKRFGTDFDRIVREHDGRTFGFASKNFYAEFLAAREIAGDPAAFFPEGYESEPPIAVDEIALEHRTTIRDIAATFGVPIDDLVALNPAWSSRAVEKNLPLPEGLAVWLPGGALAAADGASPPPASFRRYTVQRGDTLSGVAHSFDIELATLRALNDIPPGSSLIRVGQTLRVGPGTATEVHVVRSGDTLLRIASRYGIRLRDLLSANTLNVSSVIHPGQAIVIP